MARGGPYFTEKARLMAAQRRRERAALKSEVQHLLEVFVTRVDTRYRWEIRQYGGVPVQTADESFESPDQAHAAGVRVLPDLERGSVDYGSFRSKICLGGLSGQNGGQTGERDDNIDRPRR